MEANTLVIKSKSSNTAMTKLTLTGGQNTEKKSLSSGRFRNVNSKKRGMYTVSPVAKGSSDVPKIPRRSKRGDKTFMNSCLSLLSQNTIETQFPESCIQKLSKLKEIKTKAIAETVDEGSQDLDAIYNSNDSPVSVKSNRKGVEPILRTTSPKQRRPRFRSKALNGNFSFNRYGSPSKAAAQPSNSPIKKVGVDQKSSPKRLNSPDLKSAQKSKDIIEVNEKEIKNEVEKLKAAIEPKIPSVEQSDPKREEMITSVEPEQKKINIESRMEEPNTLVSNYPMDYNKKNESLFNFFVDLLETTCSISNPNSSCRKSALEIDKNVADKLKIHKTVTIKESNNTRDKVESKVHTETKKNFFVCDDGVTDRIAVFQAGPYCCNWNPPLQKVRRPKSPYRCDRRICRRETYGNDYRSNLKSESYSMAQRMKLQIAAKAESFNVQNKPVVTKKRKKHNLINILKNQLRKESDYFEEPENFHQALSIIARNKKRIQKTIQRDDPYDAFSDGKSRADTNDCFKKRKMIPSKHVNMHKAVRFLQRNHFMDDSNPLTHKYSITVHTEGAPNRRVGFNESEASIHSIEVQSFDYSPNQYIRRLKLASNTALYSTSIVTLKSETITSSKEYIDCLQKCGKSLSPCSGSGVSTNISELLLKDIYNY